jgi:hypothetical protein
MSRTKVIPFVFIAALAAVILLTLAKRIPEDASAFASTTNIVFTERYGSPEEKRITVSDPAAV